MKLATALLVAQIICLQIPVISSPILAQATTSSPPQRLKIGFALSGGGGRGLAHIGVLQWCEENRIPVDYLTGTSMGGLIGGLYSIGLSPAEIRVLLKSLDWKQLLSSGPNFEQFSYRRKEDRRAFPSDIEVGLRNGLTFPAGLSSAHNIGLLIDRLTLPYSQIASFDELPIPYRCLATDFLNAKPLVLKDGALSTAMRATMSIPGAFPPVERDGRVLVDGGLLNNIPTEALREMGPHVVIVVDVGTKLGDLQAITSFAGILQQAIVVMTIENDRRSLRLADIVIAPELGDLSTLDFSEVDRAADLGYQAAVAKAAILAKFALDETAWNEYLARRSARRRTSVPIPEAIQIAGVDKDAQQGIRKELDEYLYRPLDTKKLETDLSEVIGEGRYASLNYRFLSSTDNGVNNTLLISAQPKSYAPPTVNFKVEIDGADINEINFTLGSRLTFFDVGSYGAEWRNDVTIGYRTQLLSEYFRPLKDGGYFIAPRIGYTRDRQSLYLSGGARIAEYQGSRVGAGLDFGYLTRRSELRVGYEIGRQANKVRIGMPVLPESDGLVSLARVRWSFDGQDSPTIPTRGLLVRSEARYFFDAPDAQNSFPQAEARASYFHPITTSGSAFIAAGAGTTFTSTAAPFQQFTLGGPFRLGAYGRDEFRGNHYFVGAVGYLQQIARMPPLIGGRVNAIGWADIGDAFLSRQTFNSRPGVSMGFALDTRLGPLSFIGSYGEGGRGKLYFSFGRFF
jgi:NTE family protein